MREGSGRGVEEENEAVWWPPVAVMELARIAVDSGGDVGAIQRALDPTMIPVSLCIVYMKINKGIIDLVDVATIYIAHMCVCVFIDICREEVFAKTINVNNTNK